MSGFSDDNNINTFKKLFCVCDYKIKTSLYFIMNTLSFSCLLKQTFKFFVENIINLFPNLISFGSSYWLFVYWQKIIWWLYKALICWRFFEVLNFNENFFCSWFDCENKTKKMFNPRFVHTVCFTDLDQGSEIISK